MLPYVFVLDWDGTIAGRVDYQSQQFSLHQRVKKLGFKPVRQNPIPPAFYPNAKLIRPGFGSFIKAMTEYYGGPQNVFFFIYTASEKQWAHQEIAWVEKTHQIRFAKPIFTREDCTIDAGGNYRKSLAKIWPRILRAIMKQTGHQYTTSERAAILEKQVLIIDNNAVYTDRTDKLLLCPDYNYAVFENLLHGIPADARQHPDMQQMIYSFVNQGLLCPLPHERDDGMESLMRQYAWLAAKCKMIVENNRSYENDTFWKLLKKLIMQNQLRAFTPSITKQLQDAIWKKVQGSKKISGGKDIRK